LAWIVEEAGVRFFNTLLPKLAPKFRDGRAGLLFTVKVPCLGLINFDVMGRRVLE
jgi:hypothetical protein